MVNNRLAYERLPAAVAFASVARHGSFTQAATELGLARSTVSQRIAQLEDVLGVRLLHRTTRVVVATPAGQQLLEGLQPVLTGWAAAAAQVEGFASVPQGQLVVTAGDILLSDFVVPAVARFRARFPAVEVKLVATNANLDLLADGVDVAVRAGPLPDSELGSRLLWRGQHIAVAAPSLAQQLASGRPAEVLDLPWVDLHGRRSMSHWLSDTGERVPLHLSGSVVVDSVHVFVNLLRAGVGVGILPQLLAQRWLDNGGLVRVLDGWHTLEVSFHLVTPSARRYDATVREFAGELQASFA